MMTLEETLAALKSRGNAQTRKIYARHGAKDPMFGVSYADLGELAKTIGVDHDLALGLWRSSNHDARLLATMVADPERFGTRDLDAWAAEIDDHPVADAFSGMVARSPQARSLAEKWMRAKDEYVCACGWNVLAALCTARAALFGDREIDALLARIEDTIHAAPNRARYTMNMALIAIGCLPGAKDRAIAAAHRIGTVDVDHGDTSCKTPDAASYIEKTLAHRAGKAKPKPKGASPERKATAKR